MTRACAFSVGKDRARSGALKEPPWEAVGKAWVWAALGGDFARSATADRQDANCGSVIRDDRRAGHPAMNARRRIRDP